MSAHIRPDPLIVKGDANEHGRSAGTIGLTAERHKAVGEPLAPLLQHERRARVRVAGVLADGGLVAGAHVRGLIEGIIKLHIN